MNNIAKKLSEKQDNISRNSILKYDKFFHNFKTKLMTKSFFP